MALLVSPIGVLKGCFDVAEGIKNLVEGVTFLTGRCNQLAELVEDVMQSLEPLQNRQIDAETSSVLDKFLSKLSETLTECKELICKCRSMGKLSAGVKSIMRKGAYTDKFNRLEKRLERMNLPASLMNMDNLEELKAELKQLKEGVLQGQVSVSSNTGKDEIDVGTKIKCNICQEYVKPGMKLYHCTLCPDSGFNACANCYTSFTHDEHAKGITSGIYPEYNPLDTSDKSDKSPVHCNVCNKTVTDGQTFFHCEECFFPGFDVCCSCYTPHLHDKHKEYLKRGVYPQDNPYKDYAAVMKDAFRFFDKDGDGQITMKDLILGCKELGESFDEARARAVIAKFDDNGNGVLEFGEFKNFMHEFGDNS